MEEYYRKLTESHIAASRTAKESAAMATKKDRRSRGLVNQDEEEAYHGTLPKRYGDLKDEHFPLFVTFDHVRTVYPCFLSTLREIHYSSADC